MKINELITGLTILGILQKIRNAVQNPGVGSPNRMLRFDAAGVQSPIVWDDSTATAGTVVVRGAGGTITATPSIGPTHVAVNSTFSGMIVWFATNAAPVGFLECKGQLVSRTTYATLFARIGTTFGTGDGATTFGVPELRGEFIRGWDNARGIDAGRSFGSAQSASTENLFAKVSAVGSAETVIDQTATPNWTPDLISSASTIWAANAVVRTTGAIVSPLNTGETRPRNIALLPCIHI